MWVRLDSVSFISGAFEHVDNLGAYSIPVGRPAGCPTLAVFARVGKRTWGTPTFAVCAKGGKENRGCPTLRGFAKGGIREWTRKVGHPPQVGQFDHAIGTFFGSDQPLLLGDLNAT